MKLSKVNILIYSSTVLMVSMAPMIGVENMQSTLDQLKTKLSILQNTKYPQGRSLPVLADFQEIESALESPLPLSLKMFYAEVGNLRFSGLTVTTPHGGKDSTLYNLIRDSYERKLAEEWMPFAKITENEIVCIHRTRGTIVEFYGHPSGKWTSFQNKKEEEEPYFSQWLTDKWLSNK